MSGKELLLQALRRQETPRPAWVPFVGIHGGQLLGVSAEDYLTSADLLAQGIQEAIQLYKPDGIPIAFDLQIEAEILGCDLRWSAESPPSVVSHPLASATLSDIPNFDVSQKRFPIFIEALQKCKRAHSDTVAFYGLITGPFTLALHLMGNNLFLEMFDRPEYVQEVLAFCTEIGIKSAHAYLENGADIIAVVDPMTSQISSQHFETFVTPGINKIFDAIRSAHAYSSLFVCGDATRNLEVMSQTHCDNISIDENISLHLLKELGSKFNKSIGGNLRLTTSLLLGSEDECKLDAIRCIKEAGDSPGFVLSPGCDIPWGVPPQNLVAVANMLLDDYQREVAERTIEREEKDTFEDIHLADYSQPDRVYVDIITLDSTACAPCQYMLEAAKDAATSFAQDVIVTEHKIKTREGLGVMTKLGIRNIPTICIDGHARFVSFLPDKKALVEALKVRVDQKKAMQES